MASAFETPGAFSWVELLTTDPAAAGTFYGELFGWELEDSPMGGRSYTVVKVQGQAVGGIMKMPAEAPPGVPPHWGAYVTVTDVDATVAKAESLGGQALVPAMDIPQVGRFAVIRDPQGAALAVIAYEKT